MQMYFISLVAFS